MQEHGSHYDSRQKTHKLKLNRVSDETESTKQDGLKEYSTQCLHHHCVPNGNKTPEDLQN